MSTTSSYTFSSLWFCTTATLSWTTKRRELFEPSPRKESLRSGSAPVARGGSPHPDERFPEETRVLRVKFRKESLRSGSAPRQGVGAPTPTSGSPKRGRPSLRNKKKLCILLACELKKRWELPPRRSVHPKRSRPSFRNEKKKPPRYSATAASGAFYSGWIAS